MSGLRLAAKLYIASLVLVTTILTLYLLFQVSTPSFGHVLLAGGLFACMTATILFPLHIAYKTKLALDTAVIFAAVLLFEPGIAILITGLGSLTAYMLRYGSSNTDEIIFNTTQTMLQAAAGGILLTAAGWNFERLVFDDPAHVAAVAATAIMIFLVNSFVVSIIIGLQTRLAVWKVWRQSLTIDSVEQASQFALGLVAAMVIDAHAWALPLLLLPGVAVYLSLTRLLQLRTQTAEALESLADLVDMRDPYTADHSRRVSVYARDLATELGLTPDEVDLIERAARVHDVGKILIDRSLLDKPNLDGSEWEQFTEHPATGADMLRRFPQFVLAAQFVRHHHERIDGRGYPDGLKDKEIPLGSRIIAVADAFDAMARARPYRAALPPEVILEQFEKGRGVQWDVQVVDALLSLIHSGQIILPDMENPPRLMNRASELIPSPTSSQ